MSTRRTRYTTHQQDMDFLKRKLDDLNRSWQLGDECLSFGGRNTSRVASIQDDVVTLEDGTRGHISRMASPLSSKK